MATVTHPVPARGLSQVRGQLREELRAASEREARSLEMAARAAAPLREHIATLAHRCGASEAEAASLQRRLNQEEVRRLHATLLPPTATAAVPAAAPVPAPLPGAEDRHASPVALAQPVACRCRRSVHRSWRRISAPRRPVPRVGVPR